MRRTMGIIAVLLLSAGRLPAEAPPPAAVPVLSHEPTSSAPSPPCPTEPEYFKILGTGMSIVAGPRVFLVVSFQVQKEFPTQAVTVMDFENPRPGAPPLTLVVSRAGQDKPLAQEGAVIHVNSPDLPCVTNHKIYRVGATLYSDASRQTLLALHEQGVEFSMAPEILAKMGIPECGT